MSLILFHEGVLYADRAGVEDIRLRTFVEVNKLYDDDSGVYALAYSGQVIDFKAFKDTTTRFELLKCVREHEGIENAKFLIPKGLENYDGSLMLMTASQLYITSGGYFETVDTGKYHVMGSGSMVASTILTIVPEPSIAAVFNQTGKICSDMYPTKIDSIKMSTLLSWNKAKRRVLALAKKAKSENVQP